MITILPLAGFFSLTAYLVLSMATSFISRDRAQNLHPHLRNLWQATVALLLAAIYLELST